MKLESLNNEKFKRLIPEQTKLVNGGFTTGYNRESTGRSRFYYVDDGNGGRDLITEYEYKVYEADEADDYSGEITYRMDFNGIIWE